METGQENNVQPKEENNTETCGAAKASAPRKQRAHSIAKRLRKALAIVNECSAELASDDWLVGFEVLSGENDSAALSVSIVKTERTVEL